MRRRLREAGLELGKIDAALVTHGHRDHVAGLPSFVEPLEIPVFMNEGTREEVASLNGTDRQEYFESGSPFAIGSFEVEAFDVPHDSVEPVGFRFSAEGIKGAVATDLGEITSSITPHLSNCQWLILESNHDEELLKIGPYPWELKRRVLGHQGHLSNQALGNFLREHFDGNATHLFLAHLSRQNNAPELALNSASAALGNGDRRHDSIDLKLHLTHQSKPSIVLEL
jgi:phosphoribosyl 1,2-cyclic phosphodiesterase